MKKVLVVLLAGLLLLSITACNDKNNEKETTADSGSGIVFPVGTGAELVTNEFGEPLTDTNGDYIINTPQDPSDISEENPTFTDCDKTLFVWVETSANIRSSTKLSDDNKIGSVESGKTLTAIKESENWYRIAYKDKNGNDVEAYIAKTVVIDKAILDSFQTVANEEIEISANVNVRLYPDASTTRVGGLVKGDKAIRVAKGNGWSRILFTIDDESETNANGAPVKKQIECYITNEAIVGEDVTEAATEVATEAATEATTEVSTEVATEVATEAATEAATNP